ncbi:glycosyltransferase family 2 protein [Tateyamaria pelophila]|uniref:glycosyltransferase family 2 protein n=1 Tax=Tateyamaria pelophila TaxID=328415 RepID=UPI001CBB29CD|nr:glycosyltransferase family 2 protein [Tateyamaria pelophila]
MARTGTEATLISVVVNNYNYARFVGRAIESVIDQSDSATEVIVVDDGSTDASRDAIAQYAPQVKTIFQENGGQAAACNAGFARSGGKWVIFLDADDMMLRGSLAQLRSCLDDGVARISWQLRTIDADGWQGQSPEKPIDTSDQRAQLAAHGPMTISYASTSGNAWSRRFLSAVMPAPTEAFRYCFDGYLAHLVPFHGPTVAAAMPLGAYRLHGGNAWGGRSAFEQRDFDRRIYPALARLVQERLTAHRIDHDPTRWRQSYWELLDSFERAVEKCVPPNAPLALIDEDRLSVTEALFGRQRHFVSMKDVPWQGNPVNAEEAIAAIDALRAQGVRYLAIFSHSLWWRDCYPGFFQHLGRIARLLQKSKVGEIYQM